MSSDDQLIDVAGENPLAALLWPWLLTALDDWGRAEASAKQIKARVFPMISNVGIAEIEEALQLFAANGLVEMYEVAGKRYIAIPQDKWFSYQTHIRAEKRNDDKSRYPAPPSAQLRAGSRDVAQVRAVDAECEPSPSPSLSPSLPNSKSGHGGSLSESADAALGHDAAAPVDLTETDPTADIQPQQQGTENAARATPPHYAEDSVPFRLAVRLRTAIHAHSPKAQLPGLTSKAMQKWAHEMDLCERKDQRTPREIAAMIDWATSDSFWSANILSPQKLRQHFVTMEKQMLARQNRPSQPRAGQNGHSPPKQPVSARAAGFVPASSVNIWKDAE